ncbi:hypothetical protein MMC09_001760 [Bachmanniomyces sp. S44760]|nr:hypothetical protein [Bachmanniomyces sp. S44760]
MSAKMTWDGPANQQLLLSILAAHDIKVDFGAVAARLGCTARAVQEQLKKLKKMAKDQEDGKEIALAKTPNKGKNDDTPTPKKRKTATPRSLKNPKTPTKSRKKGNQDAGNSDDDEESGLQPYRGIKREHVNGEDADEDIEGKAALQTIMKTAYNGTTASLEEAPEVEGEA